MGRSQSGAQRFHRDLTGMISSIPGPGFAVREVTSVQGFTIQGCKGAAACLHNTGEVCDVNEVLVLFCSCREGMLKTPATLTFLFQNSTFCK